MVDYQARQGSSLNTAHLLEAIKSLPAENDVKFLFLDIDGVLNDHLRFPNGYCPIMFDKVQHLNTILTNVPDLQIVLSSAWRYAFSDSYLAEQTLLRCGAMCHDRVHGVTALDELPDDAPPYTEKAWWDEQGMLWRVGQIEDYVKEFRPARWAVLDDLPLNIENLFLTDPCVGLTHKIAQDVVAHFLKRGPTRGWVV